MTHNYDVRWTQRRGKPQLLPRRIIAENRQAAIFALAQALKEAEPLSVSLPKRVAITLGTRSAGPKRVEWVKQ